MHTICSHWMIPSLYMHCLQKVLALSGIPVAIGNRLLIMCIFYDVSIPNITIILVIADALHSVCIGILMFASGSDCFRKNKQTYYFVTSMPFIILFPRLRSRIQHDSLNLNHSKLTCNPQRFICFLQLLVCPLNHVSYY